MSRTGRKLDPHSIRSSAGSRRTDLLALGSLQAPPRRVQHACHGVCVPESLPFPAGGTFLPALRVGSLGPPGRVCRAAANSAASATSEEPVTCEASARTPQALAELQKRSAATRPPHRLHRGSSPRKGRGPGTPPTPRLSPAAQAQNRDTENPGAPATGVQRNPGINPQPDRNTPCASERSVPGKRTPLAPPTGEATMAAFRKYARVDPMAELKEARVPDIGDHKDVPVIELLVQPGDTVKKDQGLVTLESDKATMEVPAPFDGIVRELRVKVGDELSTGAIVAMIEPTAGGEAEGKPASAPPAPTPAAKAETAAPAPAPKPAAPASAPAPARASDAQPPRSPPVAFDADSVMPEKVPYASPAVRLFARELGVDLGQVSGSARGGRITREDVQAYVKSVMSGGAAVAGAGGSGLNLIPWPKVDFAKFGPVERKPLSRIQKLSGANLARNWAMIPHVTQHDEADITEMEAFRKRLGEENKDVKVTPLVFLIKAVVAALKKFPTFNASLEGEELVLKNYFHIGIAVDTPDGLVVPVIRDADRKGLLELARELAEVSARAREKKLSAADMQGGCFSISSLGGIGGTAFTPIINAPEVAILGVSRSAMKPVWNGKEFAPRLMLPLSLSYDHRVIDGAAAARFTSYLSQVLADLRRLLL
ncbi:MAG TPA: dihydrolipoyllysine-residue acetyltransferase [Arenimonas sp.]|nr:dihydrolipoyllysine-residue acetyltransferase [Arenimonas sp.]